MRQERLLKYKQTARQYQSSRYETLDSDLINAISIHKHIVNIIAQFKCTESKIQMYKN